MASVDIRSVLFRLRDAINSGDLDQIDEVMAPQYVRHDPSTLMRQIDREEYKAAFTRFRRAFPDARWDLEEVLADGDRVVGR